MGFIDNINDEAVNDHYNNLKDGTIHFSRNDNNVAFFNPMQHMKGKYVPKMNGEKIEYSYDENGAFITDGKNRPSVRFDLSTAEKAAENKNTGDVVYTNKDLLSREILTTLLYLEFGTRYINSHKLFGSGFTSTVEALDEGVFTDGTAAVNAMRFKNASGEWVYTTFNKSVLKDSLGNNINIYEMLSDWMAPWEIMEQHLAVSYAVRNNISENKWFVYNDTEYKYKNVGCDILKDDKMNCVIFKKFSSKLSDAVYEGKSVDGNDIEWVICSSVYRGWILDVSPHFWLSGVNVILKSDAPKSYDFYIERDYKKYITNTYYKPISLNEKYDFEDIYTYAGSITANIGIDFYKDHSDESILVPKSIDDAASNNYDCCEIETDSKLANSENYPVSNLQAVTPDTKIVTGVKVGYGPISLDVPMNYLYLWHPREYVVAKAGYASFVCQNVIL